MSTKGWAGRILYANLGSGEIGQEPAEETLLHKYLGGRGLGARTVYDRTGPATEPLGPDNLLVFAVGPLTGTRVPTGGRFSVSTKSPLTGTIFDANSGGVWGMRFKATGHDALVIEGAADRPVFLLVTEEGAEIHDASDLWGLDAHQTVDALTDRLGKKNTNVACIGPAGENLVRISAIVNDKHRTLGRGGVGAVMGSKKLKAIVVRGSQRPTIADPETFDFLVYEANKLLKAHPMTNQGLPEFGTSVLVNLMNEAGLLPTRNFQASHFEHAEEISGEALEERFFVRRTACWGCPIACTRVTRTDKEEGEGPEYETVWSLGAQCGIHDLQAIVEANYLCNRLGLDTISVGVTIGCAMELSERGILNGGPRFGDAALLPNLLRQIAYRQGLGDELAEGSRRFAALHGAPEYAMQVKGSELPAYDPRGMQGQGLGFATSNRGACHLRGNMLGPEVLGVPKMVDRFANRGRAGLLIVHQHLSAAIDSLVVCKFSAFALNEEHFARLLSAATGIHFEAQDLMTIGERIWNLERLYNLREGFTRADDTLPRRLLEEPPPDGPTQGQVVRLKPMLDEYYRFRGWDAQGIPTPKKLAQLGLA